MFSKKKARVKLCIIDACQEAIKGPTGATITNPVPMGSRPSKKQSEESEKKQSGDKFPRKGSPCARQLKTSPNGTDFVTIFATDVGTTAMATASGTWFTDAFLASTEDTSLKL